MAPTIWVASGCHYVCSGAVIGDNVDMIHADTFCNLLVQGRSWDTSGQLRVRIQTSDGTTSGSFTDPTSGLAQMPTSFMSGGVLFLNSGALGSGVIMGGYSGNPSMASGFCVAAGFQRPHRYARAILMSGDFFRGNCAVSFVSQLKVTGSGAGYTFSPGSGTINV